MAMNANPDRKQSDIGFAAVLISVAVWAYFEAGDYAGSSGIYPRVLAFMLAVGAILVVLRSLVQVSSGGDGRRLFLHTRRFLLGGLVLAAYVIGIDLVGYLLPSLVIGVCVPVMLGYRNLPLAIAVTLGTIVFILTVFYVLLARPLPPDILDSLLGYLR